MQFLQLEKIRSEKFGFFFIFSKMVWNLSVPSAQFYGDRGLNSGFPGTFLPEGANVFIGVGFTEDFP